MSLIHETHFFYQKTEKPKILSINALELYPLTKREKPPKMLFYRPVIYSGVYWFRLGSKVLVACGGRRLASLIIRQNNN